MFLVHDRPGFPNIHPRLTGPLVGAHLEADHGLPLLQLLLRKGSLVPLRDLSSDTGTVKTILLGDRAQGKEAQQNLGVYGFRGVNVLK